MTVRDLRAVFGGLIRVVVRQLIIVPGVCKDDKQLFFGKFDDLVDDDVLNMKVNCCGITTHGRFNYPTIHVNVG